MTNIEQKALELVNEVCAEWGVSPVKLAYINRDDIRHETLCRAIEQHERFRQEVSDAIHKHWGNLPCEFARFIITKPDPLVEAVKDILNEDSLHEAEEFSDAIRAALAKRGLEIREKGE